MTLLTICQAIAKNTGAAVPTAVAASTTREHVEMVQCVNEAAQDAARRVDWGKLSASITLIGTGAATMYAMPSGFARLVKGVAILNASNAVVRPVTRAEWDFLTPSQGVPRYYLMEGAQIRFWPYLANAATATAYYQSENWCSNGASSFTADDDTSTIPEQVVTKGAISRWRRLKGLDFTDHEAEYEAALNDYASFDDGGA